PADETSTPAAGVATAPRAKGDGGDTEGDAGATPGRADPGAEPATRGQRGGNPIVVTTLCPNDRFEGGKQEGSGDLPSSPDLRPGRGGGEGAQDGDGGGSKRVAAGPRHVALGGADGGAAGESVRDVGPANGAPLAGPARELPSELQEGGGRRGAKGGGNG